MNKAWLSIFGIWMLFLTGILAQVVGSPGIIQAMRLKNLLDTKNKQTTDLENEILQLQAEAQQLEQNRVVQQREIRRVLGYAAEDEIIFDFSAPDRL